MAEQTRRRAEVLTAAIREAVRSELAEHGYSGVTFEGVARRMCTSKPVLYRRYRSRAHLVADAVGAELREVPATASTGSLRGDLVATLSPLLDLVRTVGSGTIRALLGEADNDLLAEVGVLNVEAISASMREVVDTAVQRGEVGQRPIPEMALLAPVWVLLRAVITQVEGDEAADAVAHVVDNVAVPLFMTLSHDGSASAVPTT